LGNIETAWTASAPGEAAAGAEAARNLLERLRDCAGRRWIVLLAGPACAAALVIALLQQHPGGELSAAAEALCSATSRLGWATAAGAAADERGHRRAELLRSVAALKAAGAARELRAARDRAAGVAPGRAGHGRPSDPPSRP